jgi:AbrB family looped-hinge helix DNA binding protein
MKIEGVVKVSSRKQIVIPKEVRERLGAVAGEKLLVITRGQEILLRKPESAMESLTSRLEDVENRGLTLTSL